MDAVITNLKFSNPISFILLTKLTYHCHDSSRNYIRSPVEMTPFTYPSTLSFYSHLTFIQLFISQRYSLKQKFLPSVPLPPPLTLRNDLRELYRSDLNGNLPKYVWILTPLFRDNDRLKLQWAFYGNILVGSFVLIHKSQFIQTLKVK